MKKSAFYKIIFREIRRTKGRFLSILSMMAVSILIFVGLKLAGPAMTRVGQMELDQAQAPDFIIDSPLGLTADDRKAIDQMPGLSRVVYTSRVDREDEKGYVFRIEEKNDQLSRVNIVKGRMPQVSGEILLDWSFYDKGYRLGDFVIFKDGKKDSQNEKLLKTDRYRIVGFGRHIEYLISGAKGMGENGQGIITGFAQIVKDDFENKEPDVARLKFKDLISHQMYQHDYKEKAAGDRSLVYEIVKKFPAQRYIALQNEIKDKIADGEHKVADAKRKIAEGEQRLDDEERKIIQARQQYQEGKDLLEEKIRDAKTQWRQNQVLLSEGQKKWAEGLKKWEEQDQKLAPYREKYQAVTEKLKSNKETLDKAYQSIQEAQNQLAQRKQELADGEKRLLEGQAQLQQAKTDFDRALLKLTEQKTQMEKAKEQLNTLQEPLKELKAQRDAAQALLDKNTQSIVAHENQGRELSVSLKKAQEEVAYWEAAYQQADEAEKPRIKEKWQEASAQLEKLKGQWTQWEEAQPNVQAMKEQLPALKEKVVLLSQQYEEKYNVFHEKKQALDSNENELERYAQKLEATKRTIGERETVLNQKKTELENGKRAVPEAEKAISEQLQKWEQGQKEYEQAMAQVKEQFSDFEAGEEKLKEAKAQIDLEKQRLVTSEKGLNDAWVRIENENEQGQAKLQAAAREIEQGQQKWDEGKHSFDKEKEEALSKISEAEKNLSEGRDRLKSLLEPPYHITSISDMNGLALYFDSVGRVDQVANIFPWFFFAISVFVSMTAMTRMIEEHRTGMGMLKALGYRNGTILQKPMIYGLLAAVAGTVIGIAFGQLLIAPIIARAYMLSTVLSVGIIPFDGRLAFMAFSIAIVSTTIVSTLLAWETLRKKPANLMRPKPPKKGHRIFLERIRPLWRRLSFIQKVTSRNLFRYKLRMIMTILGIAGCTGLMFMGFSIRHSVKNVVEKQEHQIRHFDFISLYREELGEQAYQDYRTMLNDKAHVRQSLGIHFESLIVPNAHGIDQSVFMIAPDDPMALKSLVELHKRGQHQIITLPEDGILITEKLARIHHVQPGDYLSFEDSYYRTHKAKVSGIVENYADHFMYMTKDVYERVFGKPYEKNADMIAVTSADNQSFRDQLSANGAVLSVIDFNQMMDYMNNITHSLDVIVGVIIICAIILAFVVLFNLNTINISERKYELSTIKVLGFYDREVTSYIYRETFILSLIGILLGFFVGYGMHWLIVNRLVPDRLMLDPTISLPGYFISVAITIVFLIVVSGIVHRSVQKIDMVEALKEE